MKAIVYTEYGPPVIDAMPGRYVDKLNQVRISTGIGTAGGDGHDLILPTVNDGNRCRWVMVRYSKSAGVGENSGGAVSIPATTKKTKLVLLRSDDHRSQRRPYYPIKQIDPCNYRLLFA
jgi:hypothetical protein